MTIARALGADPNAWLDIAKLRYLRYVPDEAAKRQAGANGGPAPGSR